MVRDHKASALATFKVARAEMEMKDSVITVGTKQKNHMQKICGIELKGSDAIIAVLQGDRNNFKIIEIPFKKITLKDSNNQKDVKAFYVAMMDFFKANDFDKIGIKARAVKGRFTGGATSFKMEGLIQNSDSEVEIILGKTMKALLKDSDVKFEGVNNYQIEAMKVAYCLLIS